MANKISDLIEELESIKTQHGDLPVGGETRHGVRLTVCDEEGCDAEVYNSTPKDVFIECG